MAGLIVTQLLNGICIGFIYTLVALGLTIVLGLMGVINFGHGAGYLIGGYIAFSVVGLASGNFWFTILLSLVGGALLGVVFFFAIAKPLERRPPLEPMVALIGVNLIMVQLVSDVWGPDYKPLTMPLGSFHLKFGAVDITYPWYYILATVICAVLVASMYLLFNNTDLGIRSLACIQNRDMSRCLGVSSLRLGLFVFALGMALASLGGSLAAPIFSVHPSMGDQLLIFLFIIVIVGGVGSIAGSLIAGLGISILKALASIWLSGNVATILTLGVLVIFLLWKPRGIMGVEEVLE